VVPVPAKIWYRSLPGEPCQNSFVASLITRYSSRILPHYPSEAIVSKLSEQSSDVQITVYFGSWCGACKQMVPRIMKVAEQLAGSKINFDFYGLPRGITGDPEASRIDIHAVPTGVIYLDGKEIGRIEGSGWRVPELAINNILINPSS